MFDSEEAFENWWDDAVAASARGELTTWSEHEIDQHPLFCSNIPEDISVNPGLVAMQNLIYDETPENVATTFKSNGNDALLHRKFQDAVIFYSKGLEMSPIPSKLRATLFSNRAQAYLKLTRFPEAFQDSRRALYLDPSSTKAAYRGAVASHQLNLWKDGLLFVSKALEVCEEGERSLFSEYEEIFTIEKQKHEKTSTKLSESENILKSILSNRKITIVKPVYSYPGNTAVTIQVNSEKELVFPILMLYDEFSQSDWMLKVEDHVTLLDVYKTLFETSPEWLPPSRDPTYAEVKNICFFLEYHNPDSVHSQCLVEVDPTRTINQLTRDKTLIGFPVFHAVAKDRKDDLDTLVQQHTLVRS